jgi:hypothetical protein
MTGMPYSPDLVSWEAARFIAEIFFAALVLWLAVRE